MIGHAEVKSFSFPIAELEIDDLVLAYNEETGEIGYYPITAIWVHEDPIILHLTIEGETILTTPDHPFYTEEGQWVNAGQLQPGDEIRQSSWDTGTVQSVNFVARPQTMYNLTVATAHTFFVGDEQWLVHNCEAFANTANLALRQLPDNLRGVTIAVSMGSDGKPILAVYGRNPLDVVTELRSKGWNVLDPPTGVGPHFHAERQLYNAGYTQIGISRQAGMCPSCETYFANIPGVTITPYKP